MKPRSQFVRWSIAGTLLLLLTGFALRQYLLSYELRMLSQASQQVMADVQSILRLSTAYADEENLDPDQLLALIGYNYRLTMTAQPALAYVYIQSPWGLRLTHYIRPGLDFSRVTLEEIQAPLIHDRRFLGIARFGINMNELRTSARMKRNQLSQILTAAVIGTLLLAVGSVTLITIFARRRQRAAQTRAREQHLAEVGTLVSGLAHEIRNPLGPIKMNVQLLEESVRDSAPFPVEEQQEMLNTVLSEVERLEDLLNEFLYFARPVPLQLLTIDFISFVQALVQFLAEDCRRKNIEIQLIAAPVPPFACDPKRLKQALLNLILNGIQAMPGGGIIKLMISHRREGVEILIADSGEGIKPEHMSKIFEPFFSAKKGGTGLGLAIVRQIIQRHRGTISIKSELGRGTTVHIHLPLTV